MLFSDSLTAVTKIVLRSQWAWWGGVKKLFKWINSPSHSAFSLDIQGSNHRCIPASPLLFVGQCERIWHKVVLHHRRADLAASSGVLRSSDAARRCTVAAGVACCLVEDFIRIFYSFLTPSPLAIVSYTTSHIPTANAFFYRSLPSSPLATVSNRSIRNAGLSVVPVVWPLLMGGEEASIGDVEAVYFDLIYGLHMQFWIIGEFVLLLKVIQMYPRAIPAQALFGLIVFQWQLECLRCCAAPVLWSDKHRRLVESLSSCLPPPNSAPDRFSLAICFALVFFPSNNSSIF